MAEPASMPDTTQAAPDPTGIMTASVPPKPIGPAMSFEDSPMTLPQQSTPDQALNMRRMDGPVPGQSLTANMGDMPYEQPPQYAKLEDAMGFMFDRLTEPKNQKNLLRLMDAGVPMSMIMEPILLHGVSEGKFNLDLAMLMIEPLSVVMYGLGRKAGLNPTFLPPKKEDDGIKTGNLRQIFKKATEDKKPEPMPETKSKGLLTKRGM